MSKKTKIALVECIGVGDYDGYRVSNIQIPDHMIDWTEVDVDDIPKIKRGISGQRGMDGNSYYIIIEKLEVRDQLSIIEDCIRKVEKMEALERKKKEDFEKTEKKKQRRKEIRSRIKVLRQSIESIPSDDVLSPDVRSAAIKKMEKDIADLELELKRK